MELKIEYQKIMNRSTTSKGYTGQMGYTGPITVEKYLAGSVSYDQLPLYINDRDPVVRGIVKGRLSLGI